VQPEAPYKIVIGWDPREMVAWNVAQNSLRNTVVRRSSVIIDRLDFIHLRALGWYWRPDRRPRRASVGRDLRGADVDGPRDRAVPRAGALRLSRLGAVHRRRRAVSIRRDASSSRSRMTATPCKSCNTEHAPETTTKMDGEVQTIYPRKNWSSVMLSTVAIPRIGR
jgi:hypothetical protein